MDCPNKCGKSGIKRKYLEEHRGICELEQVPCPFDYIGCYNKSQRKELGDHLLENQHQHLLLLMSAHKQMVQQCAETERKLYDVQQKLTATRRELTKTTGALSTAIHLLSQGKESDKETIDFIIARSKTLKDEGESEIEIVMPRFSEYRCSGTTWHSPPFYYKEGYKMCLSITAKKNHYTSLSLSLLLLPGERDDSLKWPLKPPTWSFCHAQYSRCRTVSSYSDQTHDRVTKDNYVQVLRHESYKIDEKRHLVNDNLTLKVELSSSNNLLISVVDYLP